MLYNKYKPKSFNEMIGNASIFNKLQNYIDNEDIPNCLLFSGERGTGKSSSADIISKAIPKAYVDVIDGAISSGVEVSRNIASDITEIPIGYKNRVIILEELHNVSKKFLEALLLVTNDPPKNVYFIALTTEIKKVTTTFQSRFVKFDFKAPSLEERKKLVIDVCTSEGVSLDNKVLRKLCQTNSTPRDLLTSLEAILNIPVEDQLLALDGEQAESAIGYEVAKLLTRKGNYAKISKLVENIDESEVEGIRRTILNYFTKVLLNGNSRGADVLVEFVEEFSSPAKPNLVLALYNCG